MEKMVQQLLKEQMQKMEENRIEGHMYEVVEASSNNVTLLDITKDAKNGECFEELILSNETFENTQAGDIFKYVDGKYVKLD